VIGYGTATDTQQIVQVELGLVPSTDDTLQSESQRMFSHSLFVKSRRRSSRPVPASDVVTSRLLIHDALQLRVCLSVRLFVCRNAACHSLYCPPLWQPGTVVLCFGYSDAGCCSIRRSADVAYSSRWLLLVQIQFMTLKNYARKPIVVCSTRF